MTVHLKQVNGLRYGVTFTRESSRPVVFVDYHHSKEYENDPRFEAAIEALRQFKDGNEFWVTRFGDAMATAASDNITAWVTSVVPILGREDLATDPQSRTTRVAGMIGRALGVDVRTNLYTQTGPREALHHQHVGYDVRKAQVLEVLECAPAAGERIVLIDDIYTTSATQEAYIQRIGERGGSVFGVVVMMKYENGELLLNPDLYVP